MATQGTDRFDSCIWPMLAQECPYPHDWSNRHNYSNDAHDPGGATMCGVIQTEYDLYRQRHGLPHQPVRNLTQAEGFDIYLHGYWLPYCPMLRPGLDMQYFDMAVNAGPRRAMIILQRSLGVAADGLWGPVTQAAAEGAHLGPAINSYSDYRLVFYRSLGTFAYFGKGWTRRAREIGQTALAMVPSTNSRIDYVSASAKGYAPIEGSNEDTSIAS
jgi:lysozyme family protein